MLRPVPTWPTSPLRQQKSFLNAYEFSLEHPRHAHGKIFPREHNRAVENFPPALRVHPLGAKRLRQRWKVSPVCPSAPCHLYSWFA